MSRIRLPGIIALVLGITACWCGSFNIRGEERQKVLEVAAEDLSAGKVVVIGRLGIPIMKTVTLRGTWHRPTGVPKDPDLLFHVSHVDGKGLEKPVIFHHAVVTVSKNQKDREAGKTVKPADGDAWEIIAEETGRFLGEQDPTMQSAVWIRGYFLTELVGVLRTPETDEFEAERQQRLRATKGGRR